MWTSLRNVLATLPILSFFGLSSCMSPAIKPNGNEPDVILHSGVIWTGDKSGTITEAVALSGNRIVAVGLNEDILQLSGLKTRHHDLQGRFTVPGFVDTHIHFASAAKFLEFNIMEISSQEEFVKSIEKTVSTLDQGEWILGGFWGAYDSWTQGSTGLTSRSTFTPDPGRVSNLTRKHPLFIRKFDSSEYAANPLALKKAGLDPDHPEATNIEFVRDGDGNLTGILRGSGVLPLFEPILPKEFSHKRRLAQTRKALSEIRRSGVTTVSDMSDDHQLEIYRELLQGGELTVRVDFRYPIERWEELKRRGIRGSSGDPWIRLGSVKGHVDGIMGASTARFLEPYDSDPENRGKWRHLLTAEDGDFVGEQFRDMMIEADKAGIQLTVHAIGDEGNRLLLDYFEELCRVNGPDKDRRLRLVHAQVLHPDDFARLADLSVIAEVQPYHLSDDMRWMEERIGKKRCEGAYAFKTLAANGARLAFGSDWPGTSASSYPIHPRLALYAATTRQTLESTPENGWYPGEVLTMEQALRAYTIDAAYACFQEDLKGSIEAGKLADITVLSKNLLTARPPEILNAEVIMTMVDGKIVFSRDDTSVNAK